MANLFFKGKEYLRGDEAALRLLEISMLPEEERPTVNLLTDRGNGLTVVEGMEVVSYREGSSQDEHIFGFKSMPGFPANSIFVIPPDCAKIGMGKYGIDGIDDSSLRLKSY